MPAGSCHAQTARHAMRRPGSTRAIGGTRKVTSPKIITNGSDWGQIPTPPPPPYPHHLAESADKTINHLTTLYVDKRKTAVKGTGTRTIGASAYRVTVKAQDPMMQVPAGFDGEAVALLVSSFRGALLELVDTICKEAEAGARSEIDGTVAISFPSLSALSDDWRWDVIRNTVRNL